MAQPGAVGSGFPTVTNTATITTAAQIIGVNNQRKALLIANASANLMMIMPQPLTGSAINPSASQGIPLLANTWIQIDFSLCTCAWLAFGASAVNATVVEWV